MAPTARIARRGTTAGPPGTRCSPAPRSSPEPGARSPEPGARVTVVVDGQLPPELRQVGLAPPDLVVVRAGRVPASFRAAVAVAVDLAHRATEDALYWFSEDDYLYRPESLSNLVAAAEAVPAADYLTLHTPDDSEWHVGRYSQPDHRVPPLHGTTVSVDGVPWRRIARTTSTFGVRSAALLADRRVLELGSRVGAPFDMATWHALQGLRPFSWRHIAQDLDPQPTVRGTAKMVVEPVLRGALNATTALAGRHRVLVAPVEDLAVHMEPEHVPPSYDWAALAERVASGRAQT